MKNRLDNTHSFSNVVSLTFAHLRSRLARISPMALTSSKPTSTYLLSLLLLLTLRHGATSARNHFSTWPHLGAS